MCAFDRDLKNVLFVFLVRVCVFAFVLVIAYLFVYE